MTLVVVFGWERLAKRRRPASERAITSEPTSPARTATARNTAANVSKKTMDIRQYSTLLIL